MSLNPDRSKQAQIASLVRRARAAEASGRISETISFLREVVHLDPHDRRTLRHLGDLFRIRLGRLGEAATWYARAARAQEREDLPVRAIAVWRIVLQCDPLHVEAHERIGALYAETGHLADARLHYERSERTLRAAGLGREATILRAEREALEAAAAAQAHGVPSSPAGKVAGAGSEPTPATARAAAPMTPVPDADALDLATERLANGRSFFHYGLHTEARHQLEELLAMMPGHVEARQILAEVCRALGDADAAAHHLDMLMHVMRRHGKADAPAAEEPLGLPPIEEWHLDPSDPFAELVEEIRGDVEHLVDRICHKQGQS